MKLTCSNSHHWCCNVTPRVLLRDMYLYSVRDRVRMRYWSVTSLMCLNSKVQKMTVFVSVENTLHCEHIRGEIVLNVLQPQLNS